MKKYTKVEAPRAGQMVRYIHESTIPLGIIGHVDETRNQQALVTLSDGYRGCWDLADFWSYFELVT